MSEPIKDYELLKPGLAYISERTSQFRYSDTEGKMQHLQPLSRYKAFTEIKRGEAVSVVTAQDFKDRFVKLNSIDPIVKTFKAVKDAAATDQEMIICPDNHAYPSVVTNKYDIEELGYTFIEKINYHYEYVNEKVVQSLESKSWQAYTNYSDEKKRKTVKFPVTTKEESVSYPNRKETSLVNEDWEKDKVTINVLYELNVTDKETSFEFDVKKTISAFSDTKVEEALNDPDPYVIPTDSKVHERTIGLATEYAAGYGDIIHIQSFGKFVYQVDYEGKNFPEYYNNSSHEAFNHEGKEYNPGFTYDDVGKKVFISYPENGEGGHLTVDEEKTAKYYHNIICLGYLTDAPRVKGDGNTEIEISISGDQRGQLDATQFEARLGEDVAISSKDPIRVFAYGNESDTCFNARLCFTPQATGFKATDFIAFQKMDGSTGIIHFTENFDFDGVEDEDDKAFLHMAKCYADLSDDGKIYTKYVELNDTQTPLGIGTNINTLYEEGKHNILGEVFSKVTGNTASLKISYYVDKQDPFGYLDMEAREPGGYYAFYISSELKSKFDGSATLCNGSFENHGLAVLADIRVPARRDILGVYYGAKWDTILKKGYTTVFMRLGEIDVPEESNQLGGFNPGQEYYLTTNGRVGKSPYNQFDFVNKIGTVKYSNDNDLRFIVDIGQSTRRYNGDLPVGYMKPSIHSGTVYTAEYGFLLMDGKTRYSKGHPYDALYTRLLGWFDSKDVNVAGQDDYFVVPAVSRMIPEQVLVENADGTTSTVFKQVKVPMQIKYLSTGIYEEMPRIPFKRFFGRFAADEQQPNGDDWTPVKCVIGDCDITDIIDYGITEDGYTKPGLDNLDIHLFVDPDENYNGGAHDWHEVHEGYFNYNNSTTYGYTWEIIEEEATIYHPYGCYKLRMHVGNSEGVAYVTDSNQAPKKLNQCHYKLYVSRREVFSRQFDIEKIYRDYLTNSIYTDESKSEVVLTKACTGKAVLDAINNRYLVDHLVGSKGADIELGSLANPVGTLILNTTGDLPIIAKEGIVLQNELDNQESATKTPKVSFKDGKFKKEGDYENLSPIAVKDELVDNKYDYKVDDNEIATVKQIRDHATMTIDNKPYNVGADAYAKKTAENGLIHGMVFGKDGNVNASTIWGIKPSISGNQQITEFDPKDLYIPVVHKASDGYKFTVNGTLVYVDENTKANIYTSTFSRSAYYNYSFNDDGTLTSEPDSKEAAIETIDANAELIVKKFKKGGKVNVTSVLDLSNGVLSLFKNTGSQLSGLTLYAGNYNTGSRSEFKRIYGELIRDTSLVSDEDLAEGSKKYDENHTYDVKADSTSYDLTYHFAENTNKFKTVLGSALQAAYELPIAYWQYNTEKEWYKDSLGVIVQRVESVAKNIKGKKLASVQLGSLTVTAKDYSDVDDLVVSLTSIDKNTKNVTVKVYRTVDGTDRLLHTYKNITTISKLVDVNDPDVTFSGVGSADLLIPEIMADTNEHKFQLTGASLDATERKLFDTLYDTNGTFEDTTTPSALATLTVGGLTITAKETGLVGNNIYVTVKHTQDNEHFDVTVKVKGTDYTATYEGQTVDKLHVVGQEGVAPNDTYVNFSGTGNFEECENLFLNGGADGEAVSRPLATTDYAENEYKYTSEEAESIKEFLTTIIDNSSTGQNITSTVGMLLLAAKETQERLLRVEASTFGRDYEQIPGAHKPYVLTDMPGVVPDPTNYGLNRLIRAICQELYYDSNPFDTALANGNNEINKSSFSRIDRIDREIHGELNTENSLKTAPNVLDAVDSSTYPYEDMIRAKDDTEVRLAEFTKDQSYIDIANERGTNVKTRVDMMTYNKNIDGDYTSELESNIQEDESHFNGIVDAIYRITTKLNALTESINNGDNIANSPIRLNTIRQNIEHIIREAYFDDSSNYIPGNVDKTKTESFSGNPIVVYKDFTTEEAETYHDVDGVNHRPYMKDLSRFDKLTNNLYNYVIKVSGEALSNFGDFYPIPGEKVLNRTPVRDPETGGVTLVDTEKQVFYSGRQFNGKHLLVDSEKAKVLDGTNMGGYTSENHIPQNLNDYNYATLIDIVVDAIGDEFFRKQVTKKEYKDDYWNNKTELRHNRTISNRLDLIEDCLDKLVAKISRVHSFEEETDITTNNNPIKNGSSKRNINGTTSNQTVFSIERYLQFLNDYLGYYQTTTNDVDYGKANWDKDKSDETKYQETYTEHWANGIDVDLAGKNAGIDGTPDANSIGTKQYSAEWAFQNKKNIHAGLVNTLARLQNEEARSTNLDAILGDEYKSDATAITTEYEVYDGSEGGMKTQTATATYTLTDDIKDILRTIYGTDQHDPLESETLGSFTGWKHRSLVESSNTNTRFVSGENGNNVIDAIINDIYFLPRPIRAFDASFNDADTKNKLIQDYFKEYGANGATLKANADVFVPTDNEVTEFDSAHDKKKIRDSRRAVYYDFEEGKNYYDIPDGEYALSWNNREEFFNVTGRFTDKDITDGLVSHKRLNRFDVLENEVRNLRKLLGLDFGGWNGEKDLIDLKFNGTLKFFGDRVNNGFSGNPYGLDLGISGNKDSFTDQFNIGGDYSNGKWSGPTETNFLKFLLNTDKSERLLRAELGFTDASWAKVKDYSDNNTIPKSSGYDFWYDWTYSRAGKGSKETFSSAKIDDGNESKLYSTYGLFRQQDDATYQNRHSVYDRLLALEQNAVRVDSWLDSVKNVWRENDGNGTDKLTIGKGKGTGNIFDILAYLGNYTWDNGENTKNLYGEFGLLNLKNLTLAEKDVKELYYNDVTDELAGHHNALINIYDIIGTDTLSEEERARLIGTSANDVTRVLTKKDTLWARLNAVETLNQNDLDITNVIALSNEYVNHPLDGKDTVTSEAKYSTLTVGYCHLATSFGDDYKPREKELIASKSYVDAKINEKISEYHEYVGDIQKPGSNLNGKDFASTPETERVEHDETSETANKVELAQTKFDEHDYLSANSVNNYIAANNELLRKEHANLHNVYNNLNNLMTALNYTYNQDCTRVTTGSLLAWD